MSKGTNKHSEIPLVEKLAEHPKPDSAKEPTKEEPKTPPLPSPVGTETATPPVKTEETIAPIPSAEEPTNAAPTEEPTSKPAVTIKHLNGREIHVENDSQPYYVVMPQVPVFLNNSRSALSELKKGDKVEPKTRDGQVYELRAFREWTKS